MKTHRPALLMLALFLSATTQAQQPAVAEAAKPTSPAAATKAPEGLVQSRARVSTRGVEPALSPEAVQLRSQLAAVNDVDKMLALAAGFDEKGQFENAIVTLERVLQLRPMAGNIQYELAAEFAQLDRKRQTYDLLLKMQTTGYAFDPSLDDRFEKVHGTEVWDYLVLNLQANAKPFGEGKLAMTLPNEDTLIESIAYDEKAKQVLAGSMRDGGIYRVSADGKTMTPFIVADKVNQLRSVIAMEADNARDFLWVTATGLPHFKSIDANDYGKTALYQFELASGKFLKRYDMPATNGPHLFDHIHVSKQGKVYLGDSAQRRIYQLEAAGPKLILQNPKLTHIRGITTSDDGRMLYFADTELGIFSIDLQLGKPLAVLGPPTLTLFGIDGLYYWKGHLVAIQNAFPPARVMRLKLDKEDGATIQSSLPLDAGNPAMKAPTRGLVSGDSLYFIANSQKPNYDRYGLPDKSKLEGVGIWKSDLTFALNQVLDRTEIKIGQAKGKMK